MTSINDKLGLKRPGKRSMMKLPENAAERTRLTSAKCPACARTGAVLSKTKPGAYYCTYCNHLWMPDA